MKNGRLTWRQRVPIAVTLSAMLCGFFSILVTLESMGREDAGLYHRAAAQLIMLAMMLDGIDGNLARRLKGCSVMGSELDTYVDMTAFGIAPALLIYVVTLRGALIWRVLMTSAVVLSGVVRLARFKAIDPARGQFGFSGLPITACAGWVATLVFISESEPVDRFSLNRGPMAVLFLTGVAAFIILQITMFRYPKPTKHPLLFAPMLVMVLLLFVPHWKLSVCSAVAMLVLGVVYVVGGPFYMRLAALRRARRETVADAGRIPNDA
jgi:CDP-diacylglycerol--serine O-phosphatidyltransferase